MNSDRGDGLELGFTYMPEGLDIGRRSKPLWGLQEASCSGSSVQGIIPILKSALDAVIEVRFVNCHMLFKFEAGLESR